MKCLGFLSVPCAASNHRCIFSVQVPLKVKEGVQCFAGGHVPLANNGNVNEYKIEAGNLLDFDSQCSSAIIKRFFYAGSSHFYSSGKCY